MVNIAVFASGEGTNALNLIQHFQSHPKARITLVVSNNPHAAVLAKAVSNEVETILIIKEELAGNALVEQLKKRQITFIVLAGFLKLLPESLINAFPHRIINIHPSLLPKFGGKGMYGTRVHQSVIDSGEKETGITIHYVNRNFDEGEIIESYKTQVSENDTAVTLMHKVRELELKYLPLVVEKITDQL